MIRLSLGGGGGGGVGVTRYLLVSGLMRTIVRYQTLFGLNCDISRFFNSTNPSDTVMLITLIMMQYPKTGVLQFILE